MKAHSLAAALISLSIVYSGEVSASAAACFNFRLVEQGVVVDQRYRTVYKAGGRSIADSNQTVVGRKKFKGKNAVLARSESSLKEKGVTSVLQTDNYYLVQKAKKRVRTLGGVGQTFVDGVDRGTAEITYKPSLLFRYDLDPGQAYTQKVTLKTKATNARGGGGTNSVKQTITRKYIGKQTLSGPLGKRRTCKFKVTTIQTLFFIRIKNVSTEWYDVKSGMLLKEVDKESTTVLVKGSIDGVKI